MWTVFVGSIRRSICYTRTREYVCERVCMCKNLRTYVWVRVVCGGVRPCVPRGFVPESEGCPLKDKTRLWVVDVSYRLSTYPVLSEYTGPPGWLCRDFLVRRPNREVVVRKSSRSGPTPSPNRSSCESRRPMTEFRSPAVGTRKDCSSSGTVPRDRVYDPGCH